MNTDKELNDILEEDDNIISEEVREENEETTDEFSEIPEDGVKFENSDEEITEEPEQGESEKTEPKPETDKEITLFSDDDPIDENIKNAIDELVDNELGADRSNSDISLPTSPEDEQNENKDESEDEEKNEEEDGEKKDDAPDSKQEVAKSDSEKSAPSPTNGKKEQPKTKKIDSIFDFVELFVFTLAAVFIITTFFFKYSIVEGGSMSNTLHNKDRLILSNFMYEPECGDIVVLEDLSTSLKKPIVKRVIATGGQTVKITRYAIFVDGKKISEPYVYTEDYHSIFGYDEEYQYSVVPSDSLLDIVTDIREGEYYEIKIPKGELFVMGDHRNASNDSRDIGTVHEDSIIGKVIFRFYPFDSFGKVD